MSEARRRRRPAPAPEAPAPAAQGECRQHRPVRADVLAEARLGFQTWRLYRVACAVCGQDMGTETERS